MPASGFLTSCAIRRPSLQPLQDDREALALLELLNARQVLEEHGRADHVAIVGADERERVADHLVRGLQPHLDAVRQVVQVERTGQHADDVGMIAEDVRQRLTDVVGLRRDAEDAVGLVVDEGQRAVAGNGEHAVPHAVHDVPEERVVDRRPTRRPRRTGRTSVAGGPSGKARTRLGHHDGLHEADLNPLKKGQRLCPMLNLGIRPVSG